MSEAHPDAIKDIIDRLKRNRRAGLTEFLEDGVNFIIVKLVFLEQLLGKAVK